METRILDVVMLRTATGVTSAVLLEDASGRVLVVIVDPGQAMSIRFGVEGRSLEAPLTHDFIIDILKGLRVKILKATIHALIDNRFKAKLTLEAEGGVKEVDGRASDVIALAVRASAPIYVAEEVMNSAALSKDELYGPPSKEGGAA